MEPAQAVPHRGWGNAEPRQAMLHTCRTARRREYGYTRISSWGKAICRKANSAE
jgi:hypothetical protein